MATLTEIYGTVKQICLIDNEGVYLNGERIALDNSSNNGYIRRDGARSLTKIGGCQGDYESSLPLKFIGAVPKGNIDNVEVATISALTSDENEITDVEVDKLLIAESEGIDIEDLQKFDDVAMIMVSYTKSTFETYDPRCDIDLC